MPPAPAPTPVLILKSPRVAQRYPGLGSLLGGLAVAQFLVPLLVGILAGVLHRSMGGEVLRTIEHEAMTLCLLAVLLSPLFVVLSALASGTAFARSGPARVDAGRSGLQVLRGKRARWIPREVILDGLVLPLIRSQVQLRLTGKRVLEVEVPSEQHGVRLLAALGIGPEERRVAVQLGSPNTQLAAGCAALPLSLFVWGFATLLAHPFLGDAGGIVMGVGIALTVWLIRRLVRPSEVVVGSDGVRIERSFSTQWVPYTELSGIGSQEDQLLLVLEGDRRVSVRVPGDLHDGLAQRIRDAQARKASAGGSALAAAALERQGRPVAVWREALRGLLEQAGGYRAAAALTPEDAIAVLESAEAPRERRIGAALALRAASHPEARARIRVAAETSADEDLRAALEQAAEEEMDEEALERALRKA